MNTIAITGGSGFIGSTLALHLSSRYRVKVLDVREPAVGLGGVEFTRVDVRRYDEVARALEDVDLVVHAAVVQIPRINEEKRLGYEVNILGTHNVARAVDESERARGMVLTSSWHVLGEFGLDGVIEESLGYRPDKVEDRARLYALSKIGQEVIVRFHEEFSKKSYFVVRFGTVLGEGMSEKTAANIFITNALQGKPLTPHRHSMYRPMFYVDVLDTVKLVSTIVDKILSGQLGRSGNSLNNTVTLAYPEPITILELAQMVRDLVVELTGGRINPPIEVLDTGLPSFYFPEDKHRVKLSLERLERLVGPISPTHPRETLRRIISRRLNGYALTGGAPAAAGSS